MLRSSFLAGAMLALVALPASAQEPDAGTTGAISQDALPELSQDASTGENLSPELKELSDHSIAAQQFGNLAATKGTGQVAGNLGDVMVLLHSNINERLGSAGTIGETDQERLNELSQANGEEFALGLAQWIADAYPDAIEGWQALEGDAEFGSLANAVAAQMEAQLTVAQKIAEAGGALASPDDQVRRTLSWGGGAEEGKVAEQFRLEPRGDEAAGDNAAE